MLLEQIKNIEDLQHCIELINECEKTIQGSHLVYCDAYEIAMKKANGDLHAIEYDRALCLRHESYKLCNPYMQEHLLEFSDSLVKWLSSQSIIMDHGRDFNMQTIGEQISKGAQPSIAQWALLDKMSYDHRNHTDYIDAVQTYLILKLQANPHEPIAEELKNIPDIQKAGLYCLMKNENTQLMDFVLHNFTPFEDLSLYVNNLKPSMLNQLLSHQPSVVPQVLEQLLCEYSISVANFKPVFKQALMKEAQARYLANPSNEEMVKFFSLFQTDFYEVWDKEQLSHILAQPCEDIIESQSAHDEDYCRHYSLKKIKLNTLHYLLKYMQDDQGIYKTLLTNHMDLVNERVIKQVDLNESVHDFIIYQFEEEHYRRHLLMNLHHVADHLNGEQQKVLATFLVRRLLEHRDECSWAQEALSCLPQSMYPTLKQALQLLTSRPLEWVQANQEFTEKIINHMDLTIKIHPGEGPSTKRHKI